jgi:hypothetical protein
MHAMHSTVPHKPGAAPASADDGPDTERLFSLRDETGPGPAPLVVAEDGERGPPQLRDLRLPVPHMYSA